MTQSLSGPRTLGKVSVRLEAPGAPWPRRNGDPAASPPSPAQPFRPPRMEAPASAQTPHPHEPISFGIDQILNSPDQDSAPAPRGPDGASYLGGPPGGRPGAAYPSLPASFAGLGAPFEDAGSYSVNLSLAPAGVIRVPAHRPLPGAVPPPLPSALPAMPSVPTVSSLGGLNFPWMESSRRFVKDRFTGEQSGPPGARPRLSGGQGRRALCTPLPGSIPEAQAWRRPRRPGLGAAMGGEGKSESYGSGVKGGGKKKPASRGRGGRHCLA